VQAANLVCSRSTRLRSRGTAWLEGCGLAATGSRQAASDPPVCAKAVVAANLVHWNARVRERTAAFGGRSRRPASSATLGRKAHSCDRHHIASARPALISSIIVTACAVVILDGSSEFSPAHAGLCVLMSRLGAGRQVTIQSMLARMGRDRGTVHRNPAVQRSPAP
jgi:hypothetical protein